MFPGFINETLNWLVGREQFGLARNLTLSAFDALPSVGLAERRFLTQKLIQCRSFEEAFAVANSVAKESNSPEDLLEAVRCAWKAGQVPEAETLCREVLRIKANWIEGEIELAVVLGLLGRFDESLSILERLAAQTQDWSPHAASLRFNLGWHWLRLGRFKDGMKALSLGRSLGVWGRQYQIPDRPVVRAPEDVRGKRVLLIGEGGAGDEIMCFRLMRNLKQLGAQPVWISFHGLEKLFGSQEGFGPALPSREFDPRLFDAYLPALDGFSALGLEVEDLLAAKYLTPEKTRAEVWGDRFKSAKGLKVGLHWQGNPFYIHDSLRKLDFENLRPLLACKGVEFFSLQKNSGQEQIDASRVHDLAPELENWGETAAAISNLDLVLTNCTSIAHLAGALGTPTWVFAPLSPYLTWIGTGERTPWYDSVRVFRQKKFADWSEPIASAAQELAKFKPRTCESP